ncbi:hypothetical protein L198_03365 [Cryptococcus wingfieldii CBS 7118]|uniref:Zn(2)-C6 fungal-type domain-containing protein n=1 Tax=Cryptococcus wingfieldii CBS 7118 TaxID=1295528 RepID=A0A1E3JHX9_9TREE|nr:hypothetical protein L198_03365 [Cryptococcus wingfieldii CBS 7118]ODN99521.1 hypothetical protein L198_03365 [Cryptococcus wingfieldii CBS 7118]
MSDTTLSPRLRHLLIKDDNAPIASLPPIRAYPSPTRPRFSTRPSSGIMLPPVSPTSDGQGWSASDSPPSSHSQQRPSTSPSTPSHLILPHPNRRSNSIMALLNSQPPSPTPSSNNSSAGSVIRAEPEWQRPSLSYPRRPPPATFPTIEQSSSAAYFDERPSLPPTPGSYYQSMSADGSSDERPTVYRRHSSHPYERYDRSVYAPPYHPPVHRHSTPHHTLPPSTSLMSPPSVPVYLDGTRPSPYDDFRIISTASRAPISRTTKACNSCRSRKVRCDAGAANGGVATGKEPCMRCRESGLECVYSTVQKKRGPCPGTARPSVSKSRRSSSQSRQSRSQARGSMSSKPQLSPMASHRSSVASSRSIQDVVTPEDTPWSHTPHGYGFPFPAASNGVQVQGYDWHAANSGAGSDKMPPAWTGAQVGPRGSYSTTPWDERRWSAEGGVRGYP